MTLPAPAETAPQWLAVKDLFQACLDSSPAERERLLGHAGTAPAAVRAEVAALLAAQAAASALDAGAAAFAAPLFALEPAEESAPERLGAYRLLRELGRGGMGVVWLAERDDPELRQQVAIKRVRAACDSPELRARFRRERAILARLAHDRIARLLDGGVDAEGRPWFALEYVEGEPITRWCDARRLPLRARVTLFLEVLDAVSYAHRNLVVHRDLKPANVLVDAHGRIKLLDFGIAKLLADEDEASRTAFGVQPLTPTHAAPEQLRGEAVSTATDVYALGVLLYELCTGLLPYRADPGSRAALAAAVQSQEAERASRALSRTGVDAIALAAARGATPAALRRALQPDLDLVLSIALAKAPEARHAGADALAADLQAWLAQRPLTSRPTPRLRRARQFLRRHRLALGAASVVALTALGGLGATLWQARLALRHAATERAVRDFTTGLFAANDPDQARGRTVPLREVLDEGARRAEQGLSDQPALRGALLSDLGAIYASLGDGDRALHLLGNARDTLLALPDADPDELARVWLRLAETQLQTSGFDAAARSSDAALALLRDRPLSDALRLQGELLRTRIDEETDQLDAAQQRIEGVVTTLRAGAADAARLSEALAALGNLRRLQTRYEEATALHAEALTLARSVDPDDPVIATRLHELASAQQQTSQPAAAIPLLREAYALHLRLHGPRHPQTLSTEGELAQALATRAEYAEAEPLLRRNIAARREVFGAGNSEVAHPLNNLGVMLYTQHRWAEAADAFGQAWTIWRQALGDEHVYTRTALNGYGASLLEAGDLAAAEPLLRAAFEQSQKLDPPRGQGPTRSTYAILLERLGRLADAEDLLRRGLALEIEVYAGEEVRYTWPRTLLGRVLRARGDLAGAREQLEKALAGYDADEFPDGPKTATCLVQLALVRQAQHEPAAQVRPLLQRALAAQEAKLGPEDAETRTTRELLARLPP